MYNAGSISVTLNARLQQTLNKFQELDYSSLYESAWTNIMKNYRVDNLNKKSLFFHSSKKLEVGNQGDSMVRFSWEFSSKSL